MCKDLSRLPEDERAVLEILNQQHRSNQDCSGNSSINEVTSELSVSDAKAFDALLQRGCVKVGENQSYCLTPCAIQS